MKELEKRLNATSKEIERVLEMLKNEDGKEIIELHYSLNDESLTLKEVAEKFNTNMEEIREIEAKALRALDVAIKEFRKDKEFKKV